MTDSYKIQKAIFPVGGLGIRFLPATKMIPKEMFPLAGKPLIQWAIEEAAAAGCSEFIFVRSPQKPSFLAHFEQDISLEAELRARGKLNAIATLAAITPTGATFHEIIQEEPRGLGNAVLCARDHIDNEPFAVILPDDMILAPRPCLQSMCAYYRGGNLIATERIADEQISNYGIIEPHAGATDNGLIDVKGLVEKPSPCDAPSNLAIIGRYILAPQIMDTLSTITRGAGGEYQLTDALATSIGHLPTYAYPIEGTRHDCGNATGYLGAQVAFSLSPFAANMDIKDKLTDIIHHVTDN